MDSPEQKSSVARRLSFAGLFAPDTTTRDVEKVQDSNQEIIENALLPDTRSSILHGAISVNGNTIFKRKHDDSEENDVDNLTLPVKKAKHESLSGNYT